MSVTIKDIAKIAGVSHMTVSRALNDSDAVKEDTKKLIQQIAKELNYTKNANGRNLALNRSFNIGLFITSMVEGTSPQFFNEVITCIYSSIKGKYSLIVGSISDSPDVNSLSHQNFDGMIIVSQSIEDDRFIESVRAKGIPLVVMNRKYSACTSVLSNDSEGAYKACHYIVGKGHTKIAFIEGHWKNVASQRRRHGIDKALLEVGAHVNAVFIEGDYSFNSGYRAGKTIHEMADRPSAVFCYNDDMAIGLNKYLVEHQITNIGIMGFDDSIMTEYMSPGITTVKRPIRMIAEKAIELLLERIDESQMDIQTIIYDQVIIERGSL